VNRDEGKRTAAPGRRLLFVIVSAVLLLVLLDWISARTGLLWWQPKTCGQTLKVHALLEWSDPVNVVFLGSSRMEVGLNPMAAEGALKKETGRDVICYNLAQSAGLIRTDHILFRDSLKGDHAPDLVVVGVEPRGFNTMSTRVDEYVRYYARPLDIAVEFGDIAAGGFLSHSWGALARGASCFWQRMAHSSTKGTAAREVAFWAKTKGHGAPFRMPPGSQKSPGSRKSPGPNKKFKIEPGSPKWRKMLALRKQFVRKNLLNDYTIGDSSVRAFEEIISLAEERGIRLVVINMPVTKDYFSIYKPGEYESYFNLVKKICSKEGVEFHDFNSSANRFDDRLFYNPDHLGPKGSLQFSRKIALEILASSFKN